MFIKRINNRKGTSLVEILTTLAVLVLGILSVARMFSGGFAVLKRSENTTFAARLAESKFESLRASSANLPKGIGTQNSYIYGEAARIPAPGLALGVRGANIGSVHRLSFGPVVAVTSVYSSPLQRREMDSSSDAQPWYTLQQTQYAIDYEDAVVAFPVSSENRRYNIVYSFWESSENDRRYRTVLSQVIEVPANTTSWIPIQYGTMDLTKVPNYDGMDEYSEEVSRGFTHRTQAGWSDSNPYEYKITEEDKLAGRIQFNPIGYRFKETTPSGTVELTALIDYQIAGWDTVTEIVQVPSSGPLKAKTTLRNIKQAGISMDDRSNVYPGIPQLAGSMADMIVVDEATGAILPSGDVAEQQAAIKVDYENGILTFPARMHTSYGTLEMAGRVVKIIYKAEGDWHVEVEKAMERYYHASTLSQVDFDSFDLRGSNRVYLNATEKGKTFSIDYIWTDSNGTERRVVGEVKKAPDSYEKINGRDYAYIDLNHEPSRITLLRGVSLKVRVLWSEGSKVDANGNIVPRWQKYELDGELTRTIPAG